MPNTPGRSELKAIKLQLDLMWFPYVGVVPARMSLIQASKVQHSMVHHRNSNTGKHDDIPRTKHLYSITTLGASSPDAMLAPSVRGSLPRLRKTRSEKRTRDVPRRRTVPGPRWLRGVPHAGC